MVDEGILNKTDDIQDNTSFSAAIVGANADSDQEDYSSDEDFDRNRIGDVPLHWYDEFDHIGYDASGKRVKKDLNRDDEIERIIKSRDDPNFMRTLFDAKNQESIILTNRELNLVRRMVSSRFVNETATFDSEPEHFPYFSSKILNEPIHATRPPSKKQFLPNLSEKQKIISLIRGIRQGKIVVSNRSDTDKINSNYLLWTNSEDIDEKSTKQRRKKRHIPAAKITLPGHALSYHPPAEYLFNEEEKAKYDELSDEKKDSIIEPTDFKKLRLVPNFDNLIREQFDRCLDLYLCTRIQKQRLNIDPESLVPKLPQPKDLRPFPNVFALSYYGHEGEVRSIDVSQNGELLASSDNKGFVKIWEVETTKCLKTINMTKYCEHTVVSKVRFNPVYQVLAVCAGKQIVLFFTGNLVSASDIKASDTIQNMFSKKEVDKVSKNKSNLVNWIFSSIASNKNVGSKNEEVFVKLEILDTLVTSVNDLCWHPKGLYLVTLANTKAKRKFGQVLIHHMGRHTSQNVFSAAHPITKVEIQRFSFHPLKPQLFLISKQFLFCYDLAEKRILKKIKGGSKWLSSLAVHPSGEHVLLGGYDKKVNWVDLDYKAEPFKSMKFHTKAVRSVTLHKRYPLMATASDDEVHIFYSKVYTDLIRNPMLVPVKKLTPHFVVADIGIYEVVFHPIQPWLFTCGGDKNIHLFQNIP